MCEWIWEFVLENWLGIVTLGLIILFGLLSTIPRYRIRYTVGRYKGRLAHHLDVMKRRGNSVPDSFKWYYKTNKMNKWEEMSTEIDSTLEAGIGETERGGWFPIADMKGNERKRFSVTNPDPVITWKLEYKCLYITWTEKRTFMWKNNRWEPTHLIP
jgi:hypothetical protein